ncbi:hypothetical protein HD806DRAFT_118827 [Xylariaceae sp. AK1471]|nr:hypothetical protein HD806DRAFT_118827 [Xylariaceae sp. AK1471]
MEVVGPIGFAFGALGFLLNTISKIDEKSREFRECERRLRAYKRELVVCHSKMKTWTLVWQDGSIHGEESYRYMWSECYDEIIHGLKDIVDLSAQIKKSIGEVSNLVQQPDQDGLSVWRGVVSRLAKKGPETVKGIAMALYKNQTLADQVGRLKSTVDNITELSKRELQNRLGDYLTGDPTAADVDKAVRLQKFVQSLTRLASKLYEERAAAQATNQWALELRSPDEYGNVKDWDHTSRVFIDFTFVILRPPASESERRLRVNHYRYQAENSDDPVNWQQIILGQANAPDIANNVPRSPTRKSRPFRELFRDGFFDHKLMYRAWEQDQARLALALSNWALLLWDTNWTANLCCRGLRFVRPVSEGGFSTHTFTVEEHEHCIHHEWKLKNFGLVLAEIILATPIRPVIADVEHGPHYEKWAKAENHWIWISRENILKEVCDKSKSASLRDAIKFCLDERSPLATGPFSSNFLQQYIDSVFKP